jgi:ATP-binding cassette subfamily A (ABC1) protein 3
MDPKARRQVWQMIKKLKRGRVVLLTTHAMEEADALADRIAVMCDGEISCVGSSLFLKNTYSDGYR